MEFLRLLLRRLLRGLKWRPRETSAVFSGYRNKLLVLFLTHTLAFNLIRINGVSEPKTNVSKMTSVNLLLLLTRNSQLL